MMEEGEEVCELERKKTASILCGNEHSSKESSTVTKTTSSSSSSSSTDVTDCVLSDEVNEHIINTKNDIVYFDGDQGSESSGATDAIESQTEDILCEDKKNLVNESCEIEESKEEEEEIEFAGEDYDVVEKTLENQDTHDLYCPNCNSCITKRVLLKRRKRRIPHPYVLEESKRLRGPFGHETLHSDDNVPLLDGHGNTVREPSIWQCLSCFSIFIPKGSGPKMVPSSKDEEEIKTLTKPLKNATANSNWFSFKWKRTVPEQGGKALSTPPINLNTPAQNTTDPLQAALVINETPEAENAEALSSEEPLKLQAPPPQDIDTQLQLEETQLSGKGSISPIQPSPDINSLSKVSVEVTKRVSPENGDSHEGTSVSVTSVITAMEPTEITVDITQNSSLEAPLVLTSSTGKEYKLDILKSIVYGGLIESITSLGVISSAAGSGASTLNIFVLGLANLIGGLILIVHNLLELKEENPIRRTNEENQNNDEETRYTKLLGRRENFRLHETVAILSFIIFGVIPPVVYCFAFNKTDKREHKTASVLASSLLCIGLLAIGKAYVKSPRDSYLKSVLYYVTIAFSVSGISYVVGEFLTQLIEKYGWPEGSETPAEMLMLVPLIGRKAAFGFSSNSM